MADNLPSYENPPVIEVVNGIVFDSIKAMKVPHFGLYWERIRNDFPNVEHQDPLGQPGEFFFNELPLPRVWFTQATGNAVIQLQQDRFLYNWRRNKATDAYPRYGAVIAAFKKELSQFRSFVSDEKLGALVPKTLELTYINHIDRVGDHKSIDQIGRVFPDLAWRTPKSGRFFGVPEKLAWRTEFDYAGDSGRLTVDIKTARRVADQVDVYVLEMRAMGKIADADASDETLNRCFKWMDTAREWIVRGFADITAESIQRDIWKRTQ